RSSTRCSRERFPFRWNRARTVVPCPIARWARFHLNGNARTGDICCSRHIPSGRFRPAGICFSEPRERHMRVLGISAFYHDSAAALIEDGKLVAAAQEERFTRKKHDSAFPEKAVDYCLDEAGIKLADVDYVAFYDKPFLKFERLLETYLAFAPRGFNSFRMAMPLWLKEKLFQKTLLRDEMKKWQPDFDWQKRLLFGEHHQ